MRRQREGGDLPTTSRPAPPDGAPASPAVRPRPWVEPLQCQWRRSLPRSCGWATVAPNRAVPHRPWEHTGSASASSSRVLPVLDRRFKVNLVRPRRRGGELLARGAHGGGRAVAEPHPTGPSAPHRGRDAFRHDCRPCSRSRRSMSRSTARLAITMPVAGSSTSSDVATSVRL